MADPFITSFTIFVLAVFVGYHVVWNVTPALHTPLMAVTNAISGIIVVGAMLQVVDIDGQQITVTSVLGAVAIFLASINIFGGFLVTQRMLDMFKKKTGDDDAERFGCSLPARRGAVHPGAEGAVSPASARRGNLYGIAGMAIAVLTTLLIIDKPVLALIAGAIAAGAVVGAWKARTVEMTGMPELVAAMHSLVGLSAVLIAVAAIFHGGVEHTPVQKVELFIGAFIGAITFTASVIAYGKLSGRFGAKAVRFAGQHPLNLLLALAMVGFGAAYFFTDSQAAFLAMVAVALALG